jgi:hypothetical protein
MRVASSIGILTIAGLIGRCGPWFVVFYFSTLLRRESTFPRGIFGAERISFEDYFLQLGSHVI